MPNCDRRSIAVFDSGVGGISVLKELIALMPQESYLYFGDSLHAPYGMRPRAEVASLTETSVDMLVRRGAKAVVIACNTATGTAIAALREKYAHVPIIGIEPAIKPAVSAFPRGRILVLATPITLASEKFCALMQKHGGEAEILPVPCPHLAGMIEDGCLAGEELRAYLAEVFRPYRDKPIDAVVLGCTHYPFVRDAIRVASGGAQIFDGGAGTAREVQRQLARRGLLADLSDAGTVRIDNSDPDPRKLDFCRALLAREAPSS